MRGLFANFKINSISAPRSISNTFRFHQLDSVNVNENLDFINKHKCSNKSFKTKVIFLVLRCGEEAIFMKLYWSQINAYGINVIAIYDSPQCLAVVNINNQFSTLNSTQLSTYKYLYKLVAVDINNDFVSYGNRLQSMIYQNLQNNYLYEV